MRSNSQPILCIILAALLFGLTAPKIHCQDTSELMVVVKDQSSDAITAGSAILINSNGKKVGEQSLDHNSEIKFRELANGEYILQIVSPGFRPKSQKVILKTRITHLVICMEINEIKVEVEVKNSSQKRRTVEAFDRYLTKQEVASLPDSPGEIAKELRKTYGDDITIRVNGFAGGKLPPKEFISSIKVTRNGFDVEYHTVGKSIVDIRTQAGIPKYVGYIGAKFAHSALNARNPLASQKRPLRNKYFFGFLAGPIRKKKSSFYASLFLDDFSSKRNIIATAPGRKFNNDSRSNRRIFNTVFGVQNSISKTRNLDISYIYDGLEFTNGGVGRFALPEHGFGTTSSKHTIRINETGVILKKAVNELRAEVIWNGDNIKSNSEETGIIVSQAFKTGGSGLDSENSGNRLTISDNLIFDAGAHSLKLGGEIEFEKKRSFSADGTNGTFVFSSLADYQKRRPSIFRRQLGKSEIEINDLRLALYAQDSFQLADSLQIGIGLRYEWQNTQKDNNNFSPRVSFAYSPSETGRVVFRGGVGIFYRWFEIEDSRRISANDGRQSSRLIVINPGFPDPLSTGILSQPLPPSILQKADDLKTPYSYVAQGGFDYQLTKTLSIGGLYSFFRGIHQYRSRDLNAPVGGVRSDPLFGRVAQVESSGNMKRHSLLINVKGSLPKSVGFSARYNLSRATNDFNSTFSLPANNFDLRAELGPSSLDRRHFVVGSFDFRLFDKLRVLSIFQIGSPYPYTLRTGLDDNRDTVFNDRPPGVGRNSERGTWFRQADVTLSWGIPIARRKGFESNSKVADRLKNYSIGVDVTIQNILNQANFQGFIGNQSSPFFRQPSSAAPARNIRIGLRFMF